MVSRRDFLRVGGLSVVGLSVAEQAALARSINTAGRRSCILILMTGGPSQFETFDPKPDAPAEIRGPLRAISTMVPGIFVSETLPRIAERMNKLAVIRSLYHHAAPIHETGLQLLQTGRLSNRGRKYPSFGSMTARVLGPRENTTPYVVLPRLLQDTGVNAHRGQQAGFLGRQYDPALLESSNGAGLTRPPKHLRGIAFENELVSVRRAYGDNRFGKLCWQARKLIELGVRTVTVNLFDTLVNQVTWDCHANAPGAPATLYDYRDVLCPQFDRAYSALIDDLQQRGLLDDTLVVATGEFGRTPRLNENGGRDHWPAVWSALVAGGGVRGGQAIGASDSHGTSPADRPIELAELTATVYQGLGLDLKTLITTDEGTELPLVDCDPIDELFS